MENRIPFDIKLRPDIEAGKYLVQTRAGRTARIVCWEKQGRYPIIALSKEREEDEEEVMRDFCIDGRHCDDQKSRNDLFLVPNPDYVEPTAEPYASADTSVDWATFRRKASLQIAAGFAANGNFLERSIGQFSEDIADCAVVTADMLIKKLKGE